MNGIKGYISIREASYRWGVSERRVNQYCAEGRIPGASRFGRSWAIPENAEKPSDPRFQEAAPRSRQDKHLTDSLCIGSIRKKEVNAMTCDESLYRQYLSGDDEGLDALMKKYGDPLTLYIDGYLHDVHEAEELMLDVFAYLFTKKPRIRDGGFKAYLYKAARHMALRHKSKRKPLFSLDALTGEPEGRLLAEEVIRTEERNRILHFCMDEMNPDYREVLYLTYFEGMSYAQAAEVTGKTVKQITNMVYRGKESLRRLLEREGITNAES
ncbi:MAG: sigma-70 family RNA polymerase sigma factor [Oscillospiraceae bacterium]